MTDTIWLPDLSRHDGPKYQALAVALREAVRRGDLAEGARLPTVRDLAWRLGMTPGTVVRAYQIATQEGLLSGEVGRGTFVLPQGAPPPSLVVPDPGARVIDLRSPELPEVGQMAVFARALRGMAERIDTGWLHYPSQESEAPLRAAVIEWLGDRVLGPAGPEDVVLVNGGQNALGLVFQAVLKGAQPAIAVEDLAYPGMRHAAALMRAEPVAVEMDDEGMRPAALDALCRRRAVQLVCLTPQAQNPTTACMSAVRRMEIAAVARAHRIQILEDDCYAVADSELPTLHALAPELTWYVGSLSKSIAAGLRFGYVLCPTGRGEAGRQIAQQSYFALARPVADLCLDLLTSGAARRIRRDVQAELAPRLRMVVNMLGAYDLSWQAGVPFVWLRMPRGWRASSFLARAEAEGILLRSADLYALIHDRAPNAVRLALSGLVPRPRFEAALETLGRLLAVPPQELGV